MRIIIILINNKVVANLIFESGTKMPKKRYRHPRIAEEKVKMSFFSSTMEPLGINFIQTVYAQSPPPECGTDCTVECLPPPPDCPPPPCDTIGDPCCGDYPAPT